MLTRNPFIFLVILREDVIKVQFEVREQVINRFCDFIIQVSLLIRLYFLD